MTSELQSNRYQQHFGLTRVTWMESIYYCAEAMYGCVQAFLYFALLLVHKGYFKHTMMKTLRFRLLKWHEGLPSAFLTVKSNQIGVSSIWALWTHCPILLAVSENVLGSRHPRGRDDWNSKAGEQMHLPKLQFCEDSIILQNRANLWNQS